MHYELYLDSLFVVNFVMNLYLLMLVNHMVKRTATRLSLVCAAALGAAIYCISFLIPYLPAWMKIVIGTGAVSIAMVWIAFRPADMKTCIRLIEQLLGFSFVFGGGILFFMSGTERLWQGVTGVAGVLGLGTLLYFLITFIWGRWKKGKSEFCKVTLVRKETRVTVKALMDTGNGLVEPISGKPVCVVDKKIVESLWHEGMPKGFRAIPYHSVGCSKGIMRGYEVPEMIVEYEGIRYKFSQVYVGISEEAVASGGNYGMILNPRLLDRREER